MIEIVERDSLEPGTILLLVRDQHGRWVLARKGCLVHGAMMHPATAEQLRAALPPVEDVARAMGGEP